MPVARAWQAAHERPFFYAGAANGAEVATWKQAARAEVGAGVRAEYAVVVLDLVKAFDGVPHYWLVRQAQAHAYNLFLFRFSLAVCTMARTIRIGTCFSVVMVATCGITPRDCWW